MNGALLAIGGAMRLDGSILPEFYRRSGGRDARIVILPTASGLASTGYDTAEVLKKFGLRHPAQVLPVHTREAAHSSEYCRMMAAATGLFITGGDQSRLTTILRGTPLEEAIKQMHQRGGTVAGTSAGTAALSEVMIAYGFSGSLPHPQIAKISIGLGLIQTCIFDQHFRQRNRIGRLMYAVSCHPNLMGIGVDENTAAVIENQHLTVMGQGTVTLVDGARIGQRVDTLPPPGSLQVEILAQGDQFEFPAN
jgi:cyanophycinase